MCQLKKLKHKWFLEGIKNLTPANTFYLRELEESVGASLPNDLKTYFEFMNGTNGEYTDQLYEFYSIDRIRKVSEEFGDWRGVPDYRSLASIENIKDLFVFANYSFNLFAYGIRIDNNSSENEVYVLCGEKYRKIAKSFTEFLDLYLDNSMIIQP